MKSMLKVWEAAALLSLCIALCAGVWAQREQSELAEKIIRLHVIADSDSEYDQQTKLLVRDAVLALLSTELAGVTDSEQAQEIISAKLSELETAALAVTQERGSSASVTAELSQESYPTREYDDFSLPAGEYTSLRVTLGSGEGQNWWCVVFPPLCAEAVSDESGALAVLDDDEISLIEGESEGYVIKFRLLELWGELKEKLS